MKRITSLLIVMVLLLQLFAFTAAAAPAPAYLVTVCGTTVTDGTNTTYWVSDGSGGITKTGATAANATVTYDPSENTLSLNNASLAKIDASNSVIYSNASLNITVTGTCSIDPAGVYTENCYGIYVLDYAETEGDLHIAGEGSLTVLGGQVNTTASYGGSATSCAIFARGSIYFDGPDVVAESRSVQINNPLHKVNAFSYGIDCDTGAIHVNAGNVNAVCGTAESLSVDTHRESQAFESVPEYATADYVVYVGDFDSISVWNDVTSLLTYSVVELRKVQELDVVSVTVPGVTIGNMPVTGATCDNENVKLSGVLWYHGEDMMKSTDYFRIGEKYLCLVMMTAKLGYRFGSGTMFFLNGRTATAEWDDIDGTAAEISVEFSFVDSPCPGNFTCPSFTFTDVPAPSNWAHPGIDYCIEHELFKGTSATTFSPNGSMTRAMLVTVLYRLDGSKPQTGMHSFTDVPKDKTCWYCDAVTWASSNDIVNGIGNGKFAPNANVTREQIAVILYRYAATMGYDTSGGVMLAGFSDENTISDWARNALSWAVGMELIGGSDGADRQKYLMPTSNATRAQVAAILMRFAKLPEG